MFRILTIFYGSQSAYLITKGGLKRSAEELSLAKIEIIRL